jgi:tetratricopeptide (TPR) repeat protein
MNAHRPGRRMVATALVLSVLRAHPAAAQSLETQSAEPAAAPQTPISKTEIARELFLRGQGKWAAEDYRAAVPLLTASNEQSERAGTLMLLAESQEKLGRLLSAHENFLRAAQVARDEHDPDLAYRASAREAALAPRIPQLEIRFAQPPPTGTLVMLNGVELEHQWFNRAMPLDAGKYRLDVRAPGNEPFGADIELINDPPQQAAVQVVPVTLTADGPTLSTAPPGPAAAVTLAPEDSTMPAQQQVAWIAGGAGAAAAVAGIVLMLVAIDKKHTSENHCGSGAGVSDPDACDRRGVDLRDQAKTLANLATVSAIVSGVGLATGVTLFVTAKEPAAPTAAGIRYSTSF